jgi:hypothetical protein
MVLKFSPWKNLFGRWGTSRSKAEHKAVKRAHRGLRIEPLETRQMLSISMQPGIVGTVGAGQQFRQNVSFLDTNSTADLWHVSVDYGDDSTAQYDLTSKAFVLDHRYDRAGAYQASVIITNNSNDRLETTLPLTATSELPTLSINDVVVNEGFQAVFTLTLSAPSSQRVSMVVTSANGTAISGSDYDATSGRVSIAAWETTATFVVSTTDDSTTEGNENFSVLVSSLTGAAAGNLVGTGTIAEASVVGRHIFYNNSSFDGNNPAINASDDAAIATDKQAFLPTAGLAATSANYTTYSKGINGILIDIAQLANPAALTADDFSFLVGNTATPSQWTTAAPAPLTIRVRVGEGANGFDRIEITWADEAIKNEWLQVKVLATANTGLDSPDVFYFGNLVGDTGTGNSSTQAIVDQTDTTAITAAIPTSTASITNAADINRDGSVTSQDLALATANSGTTLVMLEGPSLSISNASTDEGGNLVFTLTLSMPCSLPIRVQYSTVNGSAIAGQDYVAASGTVTFAAGQTTKTITIATLTDNTDEYDQDLTLVLSNPTNVTLTNTSAVGTIVDIDAAPTVSISTASAYEGYQAIFTVTLSSTSEKPISVSYTTTNGTATAGSDYRSTSGTLLFSPGQTSKIVAVTTLRDAEEETTLETLSVTLSNPVNATLGTGTATGTILDNTLQATNDVYQLNAGTVLIVTAPGVLANDSEPSDDPLEAVLVAGPAHGTLILNSDGSFTYDPDDYTGEVTFTYKAWDGQAYSNHATVTLTVKSANQAPTAVLLVNSAVLVGGTVRAMLSNPQDSSNADRRAGFHYDFALDASELASTYAGASTSSTQDFTFNDAGTYTVYCRIFDQHDAYSDYSATVTVSASDATILLNSGPITEGGSATVSFTNPPADHGDEGTNDDGTSYFDDWTYGYSFSTNPADLATSFDQAGGNEASFSFADGGSHTIYGRILCHERHFHQEYQYNPETGEDELVDIFETNDSYSGFTTTVFVADVAPTATAFTNDGPANDGSSVTVSFANVSDPSDTDTAAGFHYSFALDPDQLATSYASATDSSTKGFTALGTYTVYSRIFDKDGVCSDYSTTVTISNGIPQATFSNNGPITEGSSVRVTFENSTSSQSSNFRYSMACDPSQLATTYDAASTIAYQDITFDDNGTYTVYGRLFDDAGGVTEYRTLVTVTNVAPTASFTISTPRVEGTTINVIGSATDPGSWDTLTYAWEVYKNTNNTLFATDGDNTNFAFTPDVGGSYRIVLTVTDKDGDSNTTSQTINVAYLTTTTLSTSAGTVAAGQAVTATFGTISGTCAVATAHRTPMGASNTVVTLIDTPYVFTEEDFGFTDPNDNPSDEFAKVKITTLPDTLAGSLSLDGASVVEGQFILVGDITAGKLVFTQEPGVTGIGCATFTFQVQDDGGTGNATTLDPTPNIMTIDVVSQLVTWTGRGDNGNWNTAGNWSDGEVPDLSDYVVIRASAIPTTITVDCDTEISGLYCSSNLVVSGGSLSITNRAVLKAPLLVSSGTLTMDGSWANTGAITVNGGTVNFGGDFTTAELGTVCCTAGTVNLTGTLDNTGSVLNLLGSSEGVWSLDGGTIKGGVVAASGGSRLQVSSSRSIDSSLSRSVDRE